MKNQMIKATLLLTVGGFVCKFLGAFYRIPLSNILGAEGMGIYQLVFPLYSFALVFVTGGIPMAISKYTSCALAQNKHNKIPVYFLYGFLYSLLVSLFFGLVFVLFAKQIASFQGIADSYFIYYLLSSAILFGCMLGVFRGLFQGYSNMFPTFLTQIIEQILKLIVGLLFASILSFYGLQWAVLGAILGLAVAELIAFVVIVIYTATLSKKHKIYLKLSTALIKQKQPEAKKMIGFSVGITFASLVIPMTFAIQSLFVVKLLFYGGVPENMATALFGIQSGMVQSIVNFPTIIAVSLAITLVPTLSFYLAKKDDIKINQVIKNFYKTVWILCLPCMVGLFVLAKVFMPILFFGGIEEGMIDTAVLLMMISSFSIVFISITQISTVLLQTTNQTWKAFISLMVFMTSNILLFFLFVPRFSIYGLAVSNLIAYGLTSVLNMAFLQKNYSPKLRAFDVINPIIFSAFMGILIFYLNIYLAINFILLKLFICIFIAILFYFSFLIIFKNIVIKHIFSDK